MRERHKINGSNSPRLCDLTICSVKAKILLSRVIILLVQPTNLQNTAIRNICGDLL